MSSRLTREMVEEARELLALLGLPTIQAPGEAEAQAAFMAARGDVWAVASKDYDSLLFGTPRLLRFLAVAGKEFLPSRNAFRAVPPELIRAERLLAELGITREQLVDLALLVGTDFNAGVRGIGPKRALALVRRHGRIEAMPEEIRTKVEDLDALRTIYLAPEVTASCEIELGAPDEPGLVRFLCEERAFARERVEAAIGRMRARGG
jgi:flap endonuclease-1